MRKTCSWLDSVCTAGQPEGFGDDPDTAGAVVIAHAFDKFIHLHSAETARHHQHSERTAHAPPPAAQGGSVDRR